MKRGIFLFLILLFTLSISPVSWSQDSAVDKILQESTSIEKEIDSLLKQAEELTSKLSQESGSVELPISTRLITPEEVTYQLVPAESRDKKMNLEFNQANLEDVLRTISDVGGFNIVLDPILKGKKVDLSIRDVPISEALSLLYSAYDLGSYLVGGSLFVSTKEKIKQGRVITKMIKLKNIPVEEASGLIKDMVDVINISKQTNTLVVVGIPEDLTKVERILKEVDEPQPQVVLEAQVVEIDSDALRELGIDWSDSISVGLQESKRPVSFDDPEVSFSSPFKIYRLSRNALQLNATIKMLETSGKAKVLSNPRIATLNNREAEIFVGDEVPYTVTTVTGGVANTEVRFVEPGIRLKITPSIIESDFVVIKIEPEVSYIYSWRGPDDQYPWIKARRATANVRVRNQEPFIMGGLLTKEDKNNLYQVPFLSGLPLFGNLFKYEKHTVTNSELIITITPTIIHNLD